MAATSGSEPAVGGDGEDVDCPPTLVDEEEVPPRSVTKAASEMYVLFDTICEKLGDIEGEDAGARASA